VLVPNSTMSGTNTLVLRHARRFISSSAAPVSGWYHSNTGGSGNWGSSIKASINLRQVEKIELHQKHIRFYIAKANFWNENPCHYKYFATHEAAVAAYEALMKQVDELK
jgi:hypothetical protein